MQAYPPDLRREIGRKLFQDRAELRAAGQQLRDARQRMFALIAPTPIDHDALAAAMADVRAKTTALQVAGVGCRKP
jgi:uncharacterized membrane protein